MKTGLEAEIAERDQAIEDLRSENRELYEQFSRADQNWSDLRGWLHEIRAQLGLPWDCDIAEMRLHARRLRSELARLQAEQLTPDEAQIVAQLYDEAKEVLYEQTIVESAFTKLRQIAGLQGGQKE